jgi:hypothetical protein
LSVDAHLANQIASGLIEKGYEIVDSYMELGEDINTNLKNVVKRVSVFVLLVTRKSTNSEAYYDEFLQLSNYANHSDKVLIPIIGDGVNFNELPPRLINIKGLRLPNEGEPAVTEIITKLDKAINQYLGRKLATEEKNQEIKDKIELNSPDYINETINGLTKREKNLKNNALFWYILGFISLISGVLAAILFANNGLKDFSGSNENWSKTVFFGIKSIVIIILLISASKYSFNLAKSYMNESLKISDRIHAINFGKFYLQVFNQQIEPSELKDIFQNWNINNQSSFIHQKAQDFDPQFIEKIIELIDKVKNKSA